MKKLWVLVAVFAVVVFNSQIFSVLANVWRLDNDSVPERVDVIAIVSYGALKDGLLRAQVEFVEEARRISEKHPEAVVVSGVFTFSPDTELEECEKRKMLAGRKFLFAGKVASTIAEAERIREVLLSKLGREPETIVVVTGEFHGRSAKFVWQKNFPRSRIAMRLIPWRSEVERGNTMLLARNKWTWLSAQVARQALISWVPCDIGYNLYKKLGIRQPT